MDQSIRHAEASAPPSAGISLFLRNLRLLNLDLQPDWPGLTLQTFSTNDANQNLRQRVKGVEWTLYQLFALWNPEDTNNVGMPDPLNPSQLTQTYSQKLRPFFPPLEPLQSLNLRAALYRCLTDLKKNGVLGKEVTLRKTMLDECKGDRFGEMLVSFSAVVLRKGAADGPKMNLAKSLALNPTISKAERDMLVPLTLAHRASLCKAMREKSERKQSYDQVWELLDLKELELLSRSHELSISRPSNTHAGSAADRLRETVKQQWTGDPRWADVIVNGVQERPGDELLQLPFDSFLDRTLGGAKVDFAIPKASDILNELNNKIAEQKSRLQNWREFYKTLQSCKEAAMPKDNSLPASSTALLFQRHQDLTLETDGQRNTTGHATESTESNTEYDGIIALMHQELAKFKDDGFFRRRKMSRCDFAVSTSDQILAALASEEEGEVCESADLDLHNSPPVSGQEARLHAWDSPNIQASHDPAIKRSDDEEFSDEGVSAFTGYIHSDSSNQTMKPPEARLLPEQPSPALVSLSPVRTTLLERTRQSMSLLPNPSIRSISSHPSKSIKPPRPSLSVFPTNQFETPVKKFQNNSRRYSIETELPTGSSGASTPREELFSQEADYDSVFKSRPRVVVSPNASPSLR